MASKKITNKAKEEIKTETPIVTNTKIVETKYYKVLRNFSDNGKNFFSGCCYPESFFSDVDKLKKGGYLC